MLNVLIHQASQIHMDNRRIKLPFVKKTPKLVSEIWRVKIERLRSFQGNIWFHRDLSIRNIQGLRVFFPDFFPVLISSGQSGIGTFRKSSCSSYTSLISSQTNQFCLEFELKFRTFHRINKNNHNIFISLNKMWYRYNKHTLS